MAYLLGGLFFILNVNFLEITNYFLILFITYNYKV